MFFALSKTLGLLTKPFYWVLLLLFICVFCRKPGLRQKLLIGLLALFLIFTNPFIINTAFKYWEPKPVQVEGTYDLGILLGGFSRYFPDHDIVELSAAGDRLWQTVYLYEQKKIKRILISGGSGEGQKPEAEAIRDVLIKTGIPDSVILVEPLSRNTYENARNSAALIADTAPEARCLLITSALHMPRAMACFTKAGIHPDPYPVDHIVRYDRLFWMEWLVPKADIFEKWDRLSNEWAGMLVYKIKGYI